LAIKNESSLLEWPTAPSGLTVFTCFHFAALGTTDQAVNIETGLNQGYMNVCKPGIKGLITFDDFILRFFSIKFYALTLPVSCLVLCPNVVCFQRYSFLYI